MIFLIWFVLFASQSLAFGETGCLADQALIAQTTRAESESCGQPVSVGPWKLPISWDRPDVITAAQIEVEFRKPDQGSNWIAVVHLSFPDPLPLGIPFTFQKANLLWAHQEYEIDWSADCRNVGLGMFPGQSFDRIIELAQTEDVCELGELTFKLWGGRY